MKLSSPILPFVLTLPLLSGGPLRGQDLGEGSEMEIGGPGAGKGKFGLVMDLTFDADNRLYVLDGVRPEKGGLVGNGLVQKFDNDGRFLGEFSVIDRKLGDKNGPARVAVNRRGHVFVTVPRAGLVQEYDADGHFVRDIAVPAAHAITARTFEGKEQILVVANESKNNRHIPVRELTVLEASGARSTTQLSREVANCQQIKSDAAGNLYLQAHLNQIYKFDPAGKFLAVLGGGTNLRVSDGSELLATLAIDAHGNIYSNTFGNPSLISRFDPGLQTVTQREGQFAWADAWGGDLALALDHHGRLWVAALGNREPGHEKYHFRPCIIRLEKGYLDPKPGVSTHSTRLLGLHFAVENDLPYGILYEPAPTTFTLVAKASSRRVQHVEIHWTIHDLYKNAVAQGDFPMPLKDGEEARHAVTFTPPRFGWYMVTFEGRQKGEFLTAVGRHLGVTPHFPGVAELKPGESKGGWDDPARQAFSGLTLQRVNTGHGFDQLEKDVELARKYGLTLLVQFENKKECAPARVREVVSRFKGRVKYWEIMNEPNFLMSPAEYVQMLKELYPLIKGIDADAKVLGPTVCGVQLPWYEKFYQLGGKDFTDILSIHDYEGNEAINPAHWVWKLGELRKLMAKYGDAGKPIWQTERAIGGVRAENFIGGVQAVRVLLHRDLLETLGIPGEHNLHYYLNQTGYGTVPTYLWSAAGPHPGALALRTRQAMIAGRRYAGTLDFGPTGNKLCMGLRYQGDDGDTLTLRNLGTLDLHYSIGVAGGDRLRVVDAFGNADNIRVRNGRVALTLTTMPLYLRLEKGQTLTLPRIDFGRNYARQATFRYSAKHNGHFERLTNGILEAPHPSNPHAEPWSGELPSTPQYLDIEFPHPRTVNHLILYSVRADNPYCALLDYDLQDHDGDAWKTIAEVRAPVPASNRVETPQCKANAWYMDQNRFVHHFGATTTKKLRLVVRRTTHGFMVDETAVQASGWSANAPHLMLREIEIYGPRPAVDVNLAAVSDTLTTVPERLPVQVMLENFREGPVNGKVRLSAPDGWKATPQEAAVELSSGKKTVSLAVQPPFGAVPVGPVVLGAELRDAGGKLVNFDRLTLNVAAPVSFVPRSPEKLDPERQELPLHVQNVGKEPAAGTVTVELAAVHPAAGKRLQAEAAFGPIAPGQTASVKLALPGLDLARTGWRALYTVTANRMVQQSEQELFPIHRWSIVGPFPNVNNKGFNRDYGPEKGIDLSAAYETGKGGTVRWKPVMSSATTGFVDLNPQFSPNILVLAYAVTYVKSPTARQALLSAGSDDGGKTWINGNLVLSVPGSRSAKPGQDRVAVDLKEGWNEVLVKVTQSHGGWGFYFDLLTPDGKPMTDLVYSPKKE